MKKNGRLLVLCGTAIVLGGAYAGITKWNEYSEEKKQQQEEEAEEAAKQYLCEMESASELTVTNTDGTFSFSYNAEEETWSYDKDEHFPLKQSGVTSITEKLKSLVAERALEETDSDLSVYGLDEPEYTLTVSDEEDNTVSMEIGSSSEVTGDYYIRIDNQDAIYTVASTFVNTLGITEDELLEKESFPSISSSSITKVSWTLDGEEYGLWQEEREVVLETEEETTQEESESEEETIAEEEPETNEESTAYEESETQNETTADDEIETEEETTEIQTEMVWVLESKDGVEDITDSSTVEAMLDQLIGLTFSDCADYYTEDSERETYGIGTEESVIFTVTYSGSEETEMTLIIGAETDSGYYAVMDDSSMTNYIAVEDVETLLSLMDELN